MPFARYDNASNVQQQAAADARAEQRKAADFRSMVTTATTLSEPHAIVRPIRVIAPVLSAHSNDIDASKARLAAFDAAVLWLAQKALEYGGNLVIAATFDEVRHTDDSGKRQLDIVATGTCVKRLEVVKR